MAKLGSKKKPVRGHVQTLERAKQILAMCDNRGWTAVIGIEPDKLEDISEVQRLLNPPKPKQAGPKVGRNDPCPCGSGKKFKKCCMAKQQ
ncbi:MAG: PBPRA1643 family SWIM/SEC-C metal-binding motif protein [Pseudomonadota bacterium]